MERVLESYNSFNKESGKIPTELPTSGYFTYRTKDEGPIFTKQKMKLNLPEEITHLTVSNDWLICLMSHQVLLRLFLPRPDKQDEVFLEQYLGGYKVTNLFFDPSGHHLLIPLSPKSSGLQSELLYLHMKRDKPKRIDKFKDHEITAVAFNHNDTNEQTTGPILLGTSKGLILGIEFGVEGERLYCNNWKQVFEINRDPPTAITGLQFYRVPNTSRYIVLASTADTIYKFQETLKPEEKPILQNIFTQYMNIPEKCLKFRHIQSKFSIMSFNCDSTTKYPKHFAWLTEDTILYGKIDPLADTLEFIKDEDLIYFPKNDCKIFSKSKNSAEDNKNVPKVLVLTNFHVLLMYADHITALCTLNQAVVYEEYFAEQFGVLLNIAKDFITGTIYVYTSRAIFRLKITNEQRNIWKIYLEKDEFSLAQEYAKDNLANMDVVLCKKAEKTFLENDYIESAKIFSETQISFEKVCLKFLELDDKTPLMIYLNNKLNKLNENDKTQITMLTIWLIELHLSRISKAKTVDSEEQNSLNLFMSNEKVQECCRTNYAVIYNLMASHGDKYNLTNLTIANRDYESVINQYINEGNLSKALDTIKSERNPELFYKYCPILIEEHPQKTISAIMEQKNRLNPEKLIPTLIYTNTKEHIKQIIKYLMYAVYQLGVSSMPIHNYLVKLSAQENKEKLLEYLETQGRDLSLIHYDVNYALRVCEEHQAKEASVFVQCLLELWESAVELALTFDIELAQKTASQPLEKDLKRKLWLRIAEHEVKRNVDVKEALKLLKECDLLKIEDILPFFNDFTKIDDFKVAICNALKENNLKIQELQHDMDEAGKAAERVSGELQSLRNRSMIISAQDKCVTCEKLLLKKPFFVFPCGHKFHSDCLENQIIPYLNIEDSRKLTSLKSQLENLTTTIIVTNQQQNSINSDMQNNQQIQNNSREKLKMQIENILAADCLYCGIMIDAIDKPFIEDDDWVRVNIDWQ